MCYPVGMFIIFSNADLRQWPLSKIDVKTFFYLAKSDELYVHVLPPLYTRDKGRCVCLLLTSGYVRINSSAKWQVLSDTNLTYIGFRQALVLSQLFVLIRNNKLFAIIAKIVDDLLLTGSLSVTDLVIIAISGKV